MGLYTGPALDPTQKLVHGKSNQKKEVPPGQTMLPVPHPIQLPPTPDPEETGPVGAIPVETMSSSVPTAVKATSTAPSPVAVLLAPTIPEADGDPTPTESVCALVAPVTAGTATGPANVEAVSAPATAVSSSVLPLNKPPFGPVFTMRGPAYANPSSSDATPAMPPPEKPKFSPIRPLLTKAEKENRAPAEEVDEIESSELSTPSTPCLPMKPPSPFPSPLRKPHSGPSPLSKRGHTSTHATGKSAKGGRRAKKRGELMVETLSPGGKTLLSRQFQSVDVSPRKRPLKKRKISQETADDGEEEEITVDAMANFPSSDSVVEFSDDKGDGWVSYRVGTLAESAKKILNGRLVYIDGKCSRIFVSSGGGKDCVSRVCSLSFSAGIH